MNWCEQAYNSLWIILGVTISLISIKLGLWGPSGPKDGLLPLLTGLSISLVGTLLLITELFSKSVGQQEKSFWESREASRRVVYVLAGFCCMALFMPYLGFLLTSIAVMTMLIWFTERQRLLSAVITALFVCSSLYFFFRYIFDIRLPKGILEFLGS